MQRIKEIIHQTQPATVLIPPTQWLDIKLIRYDLGVTITEHRIPLDPVRLTFSMQVFENGNEWLNIHLSDILGIGLDYRAGISYTGGAGWTACISGKGMGEDGPK